MVHPNGRQRKRERAVVAMHEYGIGIREIARSLKMQEGQVIRTLRKYGFEVTDEKEKTA